MAKLRRLDFSDLAFKMFHSFAPSDAEIDMVVVCLTALTVDPVRGERMMFGGYSGEHRFIECSRFLFVYQFSDREVRVKESRLVENYI